MRHVFRLGAALGAGLLLAGCLDPQAARIVAPQANGMVCPDAGICIDDTAKLAQARALRAEASGFVQARFGRFERQPRVTFCSTQACSARFGLGDGPRGANLGTAGILITHRGWQNFVVRHEMIHHRQNEIFGIARASKTLPKWFIEGAAYALSGDPRRPLPLAYTERYRVQYEAWQARGGRWNVPPE